MTKELTAAAFDYSALDKDTKGKLINLAGQVKRHGAAFKGAGMEIGEAVSAAHDLLAGAGRDGRFKAWVEAETDIGIRTAYDCMYVFERSKKLAEIASFPTSVAAMLAAPGVPDAAIRDVAKAVSKGARATVELAKETIARFREVESSPAVTRNQTKKPTGPKPPQIEPIQTPAVKNDAVGPCLKGGEHELDDDRVCMKCHDPDPELHAKIKEQNRLIESFARSLMAAFEDAPSDPWLDESRLNIAKDQLKSVCGTIRLAKAHELPCPKCKGLGCKTCRKCGYLPKQSYEMAGGE